MSPKKCPFKEKDKFFGARNVQKPFVVYFAESETPLFIQCVFYVISAYPSLISEIFFEIIVKVCHLPNAFSGDKAVNVLPS